jgi:hypothetical protein
VEDGEEEEEGHQGHQAEEEESQESQLQHHRFHTQRLNLHLRLHQVHVRNLSHNFELSIKMLTLSIATAGKCPAVWTTVSQALTKQFLTNGQCNDLARGAIRAAFHDCASWQQSLGNTAGCDGSLFLAKEEISRIENGGLVNIVPQLGALAQQYKVGMADFFQFAGGMSLLLVEH